MVLILWQAIKQWNEIQNFIKSVILILPKWPIYSKFLKSVENYIKREQ